MRGALEGVKVLDFTQLLAGPYATQMLGDMGAEIIKIERVGKGDLFRSFTFFSKSIHGESPCFFAWNRNKKSLAIDIKSDKGKEIIYKLAEHTDVVVQNFRPNVLKRLGYGYEDFKKINQKIIYANNSGYGDDGPYVDVPGQDLLLQGIAGLTKLTGRKNHPPIPFGVSIADQLGAYHLVYGILGALYSREKTGVGQEISVDLFRATMAYCSQEYMTLLNMPVEYERPDSGVGHPFSDAPFGIYECNDGHIIISMGNFQTLCEILQSDELYKKYTTPDSRFNQRDELFREIEKITKQNSKTYWLSKFRERDYWAGDVKDIVEVPDDPQVKHMKSLTEFQHRRIGDVRCVSPPITMSETPLEIKLAPPDVGEHTDELLTSIGYSHTEIEELKQNNVVEGNKCNDRN